MSMRCCKSLVSVISKVMIFLAVLVWVQEPVLSQTRKEFRWTNSAKTLTIFQPGDAVRIQVWELYQGQDNDRDLNLGGDYPINPEGNIIMPLIGEIRVKDLTEYEVRQAVEEKLSQYLRNPYIYVEPLIRITMQGAFNKPGSYRVPPTSSFWDLVSKAGGPGKNCDLANVWVERGGEITIKDILNSFEKGMSLEEIGIESGDQVIAPVRREWSLSVMLNMINLATSFVLLYLRLKGQG